jgi:L-lysine 6-transaminase
MAEKITASNTLDTLRKHILVDGFPIVVDYDKSKGPYLYDEATGKRFFDFFSFYASNPIGINHPKMKDAEFLRKLYKVAVIKPTLADIYTPEYAEFVAAFAANAGRGHFHKYFFIEGGALAVENALKTAFDWKVQKNIAKGKGEKGQQIIHFKQAFHGRSGYTMSLTNTEPKKIQWFPKFDWPRITNPKLKFPITPASLAETEKLEQQAIAEINAAFDKNPDDIAGIIIEPIQSEGGDNHFRLEFLRKLREICDIREAFLIFDEVQTGFGLMGTFWAWE